MSELIELGLIKGTRHLEGEMKLNTAFKDFEKLEGKKVLLINNRNDKLVRRITEIYEFHKGQVIMRLSTIDDIDKAKKLNGYKVYIRKDLISNKDEEEYIMADLIGMDVVKKGGEKIGKIKDVIQNDFQTVYVVDNKGEEIMIPAVKKFIKELDFDKNKVTVDLIEGMI
ncbi:MAG: ribosome maturation factor RimM [Fusobacteriota bacterium]